MSSKDKITWYEGMDDAWSASKSSGKPILMFFHYEHCAGCKKTISDTLPKMSVIDAISDNFVPVMLDVEVQKVLVMEYGVDWTPTFIVLAPSAGEVYRWVGYLPEDDFLGHLNLSIAKSVMREGKFKDAERHFDEVILKYPLTELAPEAAYYIGVCRYRLSNDATWLPRTYNSMKETYPDSPWTLKASAWSSIPMAKAA